MSTPTQTTKTRKQDADTEAPPPIVNGEATAETTIEVDTSDTTVDSGKGARPPAMTAEIKQLRAAEDGDIRDWVANTLAGTTGFRISVNRKEPEQYRNPATGQMVRTGGHIKSYNEFIDEDMISARHGGGKYLIRIQRPNAKGKMEWLTARQIEIAGPPNLQEMLDKEPQPVASAHAAASPGESPSVVTRAMDMLATQVDNARKDRDDAYSRNADRGGVDIAGMMEAVRQAVEPLKTQIGTLLTQLAAKDQQIAQLSLREPPKDAFKDTLLENMLKDDTARVQAVRIQYESEIRQLKEGEQSRIDRSIERSERDRAADRTAHERELANMRIQYETTSASTKATHEMALSLLKDEVRRNERLIDKLEKQVEELAAKKDKTLLEQIKDIKALKEGLMDEDGDGGGGIGEKLMGMASPEGIQAIGAVVQGIRGQVQPQAPAAPPQPQVVTNEKGEKFVLRGGHLIPAKRRTAPVATPPQGQTPPGPAEPVVDPQQLTDTVHKMELAYHNGVEAEDAANLARDQIPPDVLEAIRVQGLDVMLHKRANLGSSSPFTTQGGRNWLRKLGKALVGD